MAEISEILGGFTGGFSNLGVVFQYVLYGILFGLIVWAAWYLTSFNVKVYIRQRAGASYITVKDAGRFVKDKNNPGVEFFQLMRNKKRWNFPLDRNYVELERKILGRIGRCVFFAEDANGRLQPVRPIDDGGLMRWKGWTLDGMEYVTRGVKEQIERFKKGDWFAKYGGVIQVGAYLVIMMILLVLFRQLEGVVEGLQSVAGSLDAAAQGFQNAQLVSSLNGTQVITG